MFIPKDILSQPQEIPSMAGPKLKLNLTVEYISFSAHVDYKENSEFIQQVGSQNLMLVHGDANEMGLGSNAHRQDD
jgi:cleavage and polyadenylation specificity factor subunit 3